MAEGPTEPATSPGDLSLPKIPFVNKQPRGTR